MREWYSSTELAGLPGMPGTDRNVRRAATLNGWTSRTREKGKGVEYHISNLPTPAQAALQKKHQAQLKLETSAAADGARAGRAMAIAESIDTSVAHRKQEAALKRMVAMDKKAMTRADARIAILTALDAYCQQSPLGHSKAVLAFCVEYNNSHIEDAAAENAEAKALIPYIHPSSLYRWRNTLKQDGIAALGGKYKKEKRSLIDTQPALRQFVEAMVKEKTHAPSRSIYSACEAQFHGTEIQLPSERRLCEWITNYKRSSKKEVMLIANPDGYKNRYKSAQGSRSEDVVRLNQRWEMDSTPADVELEDGRHCVIGVIDVWSRRPYLLVSKTSKATAVALAFRHALLAWGVPEMVKTDNGSDYTSKHMKRVILSLGIEQKLCQPFRGDQKPHIERFFNTFSHGLLTMLPNYIGHNVATRQALRSRQTFADNLFKKNQPVKINMTAADLQTFCDRWIKDDYMTNYHAGLETSPLQKLGEWRDGIRTINDIRALDTLLAETDGDGLRTVTKKGISVAGIQYIAPELGALVGEVVNVRYADDIGLLVVYHGHEFVCIAEAPQYRNIDRKAVAAESDKIERDMRNKILAEHRAVKKSLNLENTLENILAHKAQENQSLTYLPHRRTEYSTPELEAAALAAAALPDPREKAPVTAMPLSTQRQAAARTDDPRENHAAWLRIEMRIVQGAWVSQDEREGLALYKQSSDYFAMQSLFAAFDLNENSF